MNGDPDRITALARRTLLDALELLGEHRRSVILVGAQAIYLHVGEAGIAVAATTKDADIALDARNLEAAPKIEDALRAAGFDTREHEIGIWHSPEGGQVDFLVPEAIAGAKGRRAARLGEQGKTLARRTLGLEGALIDNAPMIVGSMEPSDTRRFRIAVAGPGALLVAKLHKLGERQDEPNRHLAPKDALDLLRLLQGTPTETLAASLGRQLSEAVAAPVARQAIGYLQDLFSTEGALGPRLVADAIGGLEDVRVAQTSAVVLSSDLLSVLRVE